MTTASDSLGKILGHRFSRPELLREALSHSSAAGPPVSYQRLEFLGDRVLGLVVARLLFDRFSGESEGHLARRHAELVRKESLARVAVGLGLGRHIRLSRGEEEAGGRDNPAILADVCEAVIAAIFLDGGFEAAADFVGRHWAALMEEDVTPPKDAKTALQEWAQGRGLDLPLYREIDRRGPPHAPLFEVEVSIEGHPPEVASGPSKRMAEQAAAGALMDRLEERYGD
ncbi:MAG: ribonuclease III [Rhodospirillales bacterium]|jgi:ribonuclease-3|nr:ribonuclease III [Rhodospirillales bacterium]